MRVPYSSSHYRGLRADWSTRHERNVALLLRDRTTNTPLYEAHAQTEGGTSGDSTLIEAMFEAALQDFRALGATNPRRVSVVPRSFLGPVNAMRCRPQLCRRWQVPRQARASRPPSPSTCFARTGAARSW